MRFKGFMKRSDDPSDDDLQAMMLEAVIDAIDHELQ